MQEVAQQCEVRAMPTFHVYSNGQKAEEIVGGNLNALKAACEKYGKASQVFQGTGHTLSGKYHSTCCFRPPCKGHNVCINDKTAIA